MADLEILRVNVLLARSPVTTVGPCDALCHLKSCQLLRSCMKTHLKGMEEVSAIRWTIHQLLLVVPGSATVVRPIQKSIGKWKIRPPVKS